jgi:phosphoribosylglycinamide formyltransferase 2
MAEKITKNLGGSGLWGVEFFLTDNGVYFSELSPRPHDTGMVTLAGTQNFSEFELHARAILGLPIPEIKLEKAGVSAVVLASKESSNFQINGVEEILKTKNTDIRIFGKPTTRPYRRMAVVLVNDTMDCNVQELRKLAKNLASEVQVV